MSTVTPGNVLKIDSYTEHCSLAVLNVDPSIFIDVRIEKVLDVKRTSERLMVVRVIVGRSACVQVNGGKRGVTGHVGICSVRDRFW